MTFVRWLSLAVLSAALAACFSQESVAPEVELTSHAEASARPPYALAVAQELNDGHRLLVVAKIKSESDRPVDDLAVRLRAFREGEQVGETTAPVRQTVEQLKTGEIQEVPLILAAEGITDYQLDLVWGSDSPVAMLGKPGESPELTQISVSAERVNCQDSACDLRYTLAGNVLNLTDKTINEVVFGAGFIWQPAQLDLTPKVPEDESLVEVKGMKLLPGDSQKIRLVLDQTVPERSDGAFRPVLRIKSFR